jgi:pantoate--beta-alanine ligase
MEEARAGGREPGFVPTRGALHAGHRALLDRARAECGFVATSIFVNPLQFGPAEDFAEYPRPLEADLELARAAGCDLAFTPERDAMIPAGFPEITVDPGPLGERLEGRSRPGHFRGVLTIVAKLFDLSGPCRAYFGEKDAQQLELIRRMVDRLAIPVAVVGCPTVRDPDGLALSSRNAYLSQDERRQALSLVRALAIAANLVQKGQRRAAVLRDEMARRIEGEAPGGLDYAAVVDDATWEEPDVLIAPARALVAARFGSTRLIDNMALPWDDAPGAR